MDGSNHMIVSGGSRSKGKPKRRKGLSAGERAKAILKQAVLDGTLKELLWREIPEVDQQGPESDGEYDFPIVYDDEGSESEVDAESPQKSEESERPHHESISVTSEWNRLLNRGTLVMPRKSTVVGKGPVRPIVQRSTFVTSDMSVASDRVEEGDGSTVELRTPRLRVYTQIMQKLKYAAQDARIASAEEQEERESESESGEESVEDEEPAVQRDQDEILWAGVMGLPLNHESTILSGYAHEATVVELFNLSNELREERERHLREEKRRASRLLQSQGGEGDTGQPLLPQLPHEIELQNKLEEKYLAGRRALLRLHCNTAQHELPSSGSTSEAFSQFWTSALEANAKHTPEGLYSRFTSMNAPTVELPPHLHAVPEPEPASQLEYDSDTPDTATEETVTRPLTEGSDAAVHQSRRESFPTEEFRNGLGELVPRSPPGQADRTGLEPRLIDRMNSVTLKDAQTAGIRSNTDEQFETAAEETEDMVGESDSDGAGRRSDGEDGRCDGEGENAASADSDALVNSDAEVAPGQTAASPRRKRRERRHTKAAQKERRMPRRATKVRNPIDDTIDAEKPQPPHPSPRRTIVDAGRRPNLGVKTGTRNVAYKARSETESSDSDGTGNKHRRATHRLQQRNPSSDRDDPQPSPGAKSPARSASRDLAQLSTTSLGSVASTPSARMPYAKDTGDGERLRYSAARYSTQGIGSVRAVRRSSAQPPAVTEATEVTQLESANNQTPEGQLRSRSGQDHNLQSYTQPAPLEQTYTYPKQAHSSSARQPAAPITQSPTEGSNKVATTSAKLSGKYPPSPPPRSAPTTTASANRPRVQSFEHEPPAHESPLRRLLSPDHRALPVPRLTFGYEHLTGIWPYDPSLDAFQRLCNRVRQRREGWASAGARQARKRKRIFKTLQTQSSRFSEVSFDPFAMALVLRTLMEGAVTQRSAVALQSVFLTESVVPDMLTLRTQDTRSVPSGYLGTYSISQWNTIAREINAALAQAALLTPEARRAVQDHLNQLSHGGSAALAGVSATTESGTDGWGPYATNDLSSRAVIFSDDIDIAPIADERTSDHDDGPSLPVFLTETIVGGTHDEYMTGGALDADVDPAQEPPHTAQISASQLQHLAEQGYAAYQELSELYPAALPVPGPFSPQLTPRPPRGLNIPLIHATDGPQYTVVMDGQAGSTAAERQKAAARRRRKSTRDKVPKSDLDLHAKDASSRFMDLIRGAVDMYKAECEALRRLRAPALVHTVEDAGPEEDSTLCTLSAEERRKLRFYDPHSLNRPGDVGYVASGFAAHGEWVQLSITGLDPFAPTASMVLSPSPPRQPRRSSQRVRSFSEHFTPTTARAKESALEGMAASAYQEERPIELTAPTTPTDTARPPKAVRGLRFSIHKRASSPREPSCGVEDGRGNPGLQIVLLLESREKTQVYFAKKFLQLDFVVDFFTNTGEVASALRGHGELYRALLLNYADVVGHSGAADAPAAAELGDAVARCASAVARILHGTAADFGHSRRSCLTVLYNVPTAVERQFDPDQLGVDAILSQPYSVTQLRAFT